MTSPSNGDIDPAALQDTYRYVPSVVYKRRQRYPATDSSSANGCEEVSHPNTSAELEVLVDSDVDEDEHFSDPSPVVDQHPLASPTEQSLSNGDEEETVEQSRKVSRTPLVDHERFRSTVEPHLKVTESTSDAIEEDEALRNCQKTWGPSTNLLVRPHLQRSSSWHAGVTTDVGIRQAYQDPSRADKLQLARESPYSQRPDLYGLKENTPLVSQENCTGSGDSKQEGKQTHPQEHEVIDAQKSGDTQAAKKPKDGPPSEAHIASDHSPSLSRRGLIDCSMDDERAFDSTTFPDPIKCTSPPISIDNRRETCNVRNFEKFRDLESYSESFTPNSSYISIYSTSELARKIDFERMERLNRGGNATVYSYADFAVKQTLYDEYSLNIACELNHSNIMELQGVTLLGCYSEVCFHIMPLMTYDLLRGLRSVGRPLSQLAQESNESTWLTVKSNVVYILKEVLGGLRYLEERYIQHGDIKDKNVLIKKTCRCRDILHCTCRGDDKYSVKLADFDYIRQHEYYRDPVNITTTTDCKWFEYHGGTLSYRAPEDSIIQELNNGWTRSLSGPSSDIYSFGVLLLKMCLGESTWRDRCEANIRARQPGVSELTVESEAHFVQQMHNDFLYAALKCNQGRLNFLVDIVRDCLRINPSDRPTACDLLSQLPSGS